MVKQRAGIPAAQKIRLIAYPPRRSILDELFSRGDQSLLESRILRLARRFGTRTWIEGGMFRLMPYTVEVK
jgi:hypothetical protein